MSPVVKGNDVVRCVDCIKCVLKVPRSSRTVRCKALVFDDLSIAHPFILVYRCCDFADIELDWPEPVGKEVK